MFLICEIVIYFICRLKIKVVSMMFELLFKSNALPKKKDFSFKSVLRKL